MFKEIGDLKVHYEMWGDGSPLILLHGGQMRLKSWKEMVPMLAREFRVYAYDVRGHGETVRPPGPQPTHDSWVEDLYGFMGSFGIKKAAVAGWSMGGAIGLSFAIKYPGMLSHLILLGAGASLVPFKDRSMWEERRRLKEAGVSGEEIIARTLSLTKSRFSPDAEKENPRALEKVRDMLAAHYSMPLDQISIPQAERPDIGPKLGDIQCPTLVIIGDADTLTPISASESLNAAIPNSYMKIIPNCGHCYGYEQPELTAQVMTTFLKAFS